MFATLQTLGFDTKWITWIKKCVTKVQYSVIVNGKKKKRFTPTRGIRQGDPLSPHLFILLADVLSRNITSAVEQGEMEGVRINHTCPTIHHIFFVDDSLVFIKATERSTRALVEIVSTHGEALGQSINLEKSCVFFGKTFVATTRSRIEGILGIKSVEDAGKYLGHPTKSGHSKKEALRFIKDKVVHKFHN